MKNILKDELWNAVKSSYESEDYTTAILNAISYVRDVIREKSNSELDGVDLINQAFSEKNPKIKVNKLQTKNEKNIQKGLRELLTGIYTHIRNPRSHDKYKDTKEDALAIILFINYLLKTIDSSKSSFSIDGFINQVYDKYFHQTEEYAQLLIKDIPNKQLENTFYTLYQSISNNLYEKDDNYYGYNNEPEINYQSINSLKLIISILLNKLKNNDESIFEKISNDLMRLKKDTELFFKLMIFLPTWNNLSRLVQLKVINMLSQWEENDYDVFLLQENILKDGWKYFNSEEKDIIEKGLISFNKNYSIDGDKLILIEKKINAPIYALPQQKQNDISDDDEIPF
jgi:uncharacterized protein (TIGR02391 family)